MKIRLDRIADAAFIDLADPASDAEVRTAMCNVEFDRAAVILRLDRHDRLVGFEILGASRVLPEAVLASAGPSTR